VYRLEELFLRPLGTLLARELGFNPLNAEHDGIRIDLHGIHVDAHEFHSNAVEGLRLMFIGNHAAAVEKLRRANSLYVGSFLPGLPGKIIADTSNYLETLYKSAVMDVMQRTRNSGYPGRSRRVEPGLYLLAA
jgi:hypothetical protein